MKYIIQRWSGRAWYDSMLSPYDNYAAVQKHLKEYWWHYTDSNPYRIIDYKPKKKQSNTKYNAYQDWNSDRGMVVAI